MIKSAEIQGPYLLGQGGRPFLFQSCISLNFFVIMSDSETYSHIDRDIIHQCFRDYTILAAKSRFSHDVAHLFQSCIIIV